MTDPAEFFTLAAPAATLPEIREIPPQPDPAPASMRIAHYSGYPRVSKSHRVRTAVAEPGEGATMNLVALEGEQVGALLRLRVSELCGPPAREELARVVACCERRDGRFDVVLEALEPLAPRFVRRSGGARRASAASER